MPVFSTLNSISSSKFHKATCKDSIQGKLQLITEFDGLRTGNYTGYSDSQSGDFVNTGKNYAVGDMVISGCALNYDGTVMAVSKIKMMEAPVGSSGISGGELYLELYNLVDDAWVLKDTLFIDRRDTSDEELSAIIAIRFSDNADTIALAVKKSVIVNNSYQRQNHVLIVSNTNNTLSIFATITSPSNNEYFNWDSGTLMNGADSNGYTGFKLSTDGKTFWVPVTINTTGSQSTSTFLIYEYSLVNGVWGKTLTGCDPLRTNTSGNGNTAACYFDMTADGQYLIFPSANNDRTIVLFKKRSGIYRRMDANTEFEIFPSTSNEKIASFNYTKNGLGVFVTSYDVNNSTGYYVSRTYQISVSANVWLLAGKKLVATIDSSTTLALNKREQLLYTPLVTNNGNTCVSMIMRFVPDGGTIGGSPTYYIQNFADVRTVNKSGAWALSYSIKLPSYNPDRKYSIPSFNALYLTAPAALSDKAESLAIGTMSYNYDGMSNKPVASQSASLPQIYSYTTQDLFVYKDK